MKIERSVLGNLMSPLPAADSSASQTTHRVSPPTGPNDPDEDRRRSLRQDLEIIEARSIGPFEGGKRVMEAAQRLALRLAELGSRAALLVRPGKSSRPALVDDRD